jgi:hypothetical protein
MRFRTNVVPPLPTRSVAADLQMADSVGKGGFGDMHRWKHPGHLCPPYEAACYGV